MKHLEELMARIINRVNTGLLRHKFDAEPYIRSCTPRAGDYDLCAFYGLSPRHPVHLRFINSVLGGSYFLDRCVVDSSIVYRSDVRGDELKEKGAILKAGGMDLPVYVNEEIFIRESFLANNLVHCFSHDPNQWDRFFIRCTAAMPYSNIHGAPVIGSFLGAASTLDLTTVRNCVIGEYAYVQVGELNGQVVPPGQVWIRADDSFEFKYRFAPEVLTRYVRHEPNTIPEGVIMDLAFSVETEFDDLVGSLANPGQVEAPESASCSPYSVRKGNCLLAENVFVSQGAYLENAQLGQGANVQENCFIVNCRLQGRNVTAHGGKLINADMGQRVFVGFNSFLRGSENHRLIVGSGSVVMPHTIIDLTEAVEIPPRTLVWGFIQTADDLRQNTISLEELNKVNGELKLGGMTFTGRGEDLVQGKDKRIEHILEFNGAYYDDGTEHGHAQRSKHIAYNILRPYSEGPLKGMFPTIEVSP
jgi:carbonic anhydrase/acetyltransferase-like protein (isoleucine patch superfamily)